MSKNAERVLFWVGITALSLFFLYQISNILMPFIVGILVAYFLDPVADRVEKLGISRGLAAALITTIFFTVGILAVIVLAPVLFDQFVSLAAKAPEYVKEVQSKYEPALSAFLNDISPDSISKAKEIAAGFSDNLTKFAAKLIGGIWKSGVAVVNMISLIFISPIVAFYMLKDWDKFTAKIDSWLPRDSAETVREQVKKIDQTISGYLRGQSNVCLLLGVFYAIGLSLAGLEFGLFIGLMTGILAFIPYAGAFFGTVVGLLVAYFQFGSISGVGMVLAVFVLGQILEGNFLTPRLVGRKVGLHPVWVIFGLLAGGSLFGFTGVLIAIPVTATIGVLTRFFIKKYLEGDIFDSKNKKKSKK